jgi:hypothetical protein
MNAPAIKDWMIFIPYRIRDGADADGYDDWLRKIDNPFFNAIPGIKCYTNWKVYGSRHPVPFTHFDFLEIDDVEQLEKVWFNPDLNDFRTEWVRLWGRGVPDPDNAHCFLCRSALHGGPAQAGLVLSQGTSAASSDAAQWATQELLHKHYAVGPSESWRTKEMTPAAAPFAQFAVRYMPGSLDAVDLGAATWGADNALSATLIAAPDEFVGNGP